MSKSNWEDSDDDDLPSYEDAGNNLFYYIRNNLHIIS